MASTLMVPAKYKTIQQRLLRNCAAHQRSESLFLYSCDDEISNNPNDYIEKRSLKQCQHRLIACNGDCGSDFSAILHCWIYAKNLDILKQTEKVIKNAFSVYGSPLRDRLILEMRNKQIFKENSFYEYMYNKLNDKSCFIQGNEWVNKIKILLCMLSFDHIYVLQNIANFTCNIPERSLSEEIDAFFCNQTNKLRQELRIIHHMIASKENKSIKHALLAKKTLLQQRIANSELKILNNNIRLDENTAAIKHIKQSKQFQEMQQKNLALSDLEILSIILYCNQDEFAYNMRESHREQHINSCEWRTLFYHLNCAITKIYLVFHFKNKIFRKRYISKRQKHNNKLFRGISGVSLHCNYSDNISLYTMTSFTERLGDAMGFTNENGMILAINDAFDAIYNGKLCAANVAWISKYDEKEWIVCPTTFDTVNRINKQDDNLYKSINANIEVYEAQIFRKTYPINTPKQMLSIVYSPAATNAVIEKTNVIGRIKAVLVCGTVATGSAIGSVISVGSVPAATFIGSETLGGIALSMNLIAAPVAPFVWSPIIIGAAVGGIVGYAGSKLWKTSDENNNKNASLDEIDLMDQVNMFRIYDQEINV